MDLVILFLVILPALAIIALAVGDIVSKIWEMEKRKKKWSSK